MFWVILYAIIVAIFFSLCYMGHKRIHHNFLAGYSMVLWAIPVYKSL